VGRASLVAGAVPAAGVVWIMGSPGFSTKEKTFGRAAGPATQDVAPKNPGGPNKDETGPPCKNPKGGSVL